MATTPLPTANAVASSVTQPANFTVAGTAPVPLTASGAGVGAGLAVMAMALHLAAAGTGQGSGAASLTPSTTSPTVNAVQSSVTQPASFNVTGTAPAGVSYALPAAWGVNVGGGVAALTSSQPLSGSGRGVGTGTATLRGAQPLSGSGAGRGGGSASFVQVSAAPSVNTVQATVTQPASFLVTGMTSGPVALQAAGGGVGAGSAQLKGAQALAGSGGGAGGGSGTFVRLALFASGVGVSGGTATLKDAQALNATGAGRGSGVGSFAQTTLSPSVVAVQATVTQPASFLISGTAPYAGTPIALIATGAGSSGGAGRFVEAQTLASGGPTAAPSLTPVPAPGVVGVPFFISGTTPAAAAPNYAVFQRGGGSATLSWLTVGVGAGVGTGTAALGGAQALAGAGAGTSGASSAILIGGTGPLALSAVGVNAGRGTARLADKQALFAADAGTGDGSAAPSSSQAMSGVGAGQGSGRGAFYQPPQLGANRIRVASGVAIGAPTAGRGIVELGKSPRGFFVVQKSGRKS